MCESCDDPNLNGNNKATGTNGNEKSRLSKKDFRREEGLEDPEDWNSYLEDLVCDSVSPALCVYGCEVEPDGYCEHGNPSVLIAMGLI
jgi:hypothetical protein